MSKKEKRKKLSIFEFILLLLNYLVAITLIFAFLSPYVSPATFWIFAFFGLVFPYIVLVNGIFVIIWIFKKRKYFLISLILLLIGWNTYDKYFQFGGGEEEIAGDKIKITTYNVRVFNFCDSEEEQKLLINFYSFINKVSPDILCLQEYYSDKSISDPPELNIPQSMCADYFAFSKYYLFQTQRNYSIATFSKYPILNEGSFRFRDETKSFCLFTDILVNKDTIRIYNIHLESIQLSQDDYSFVSEIASANKEKNLKEKSAKIFYKLKYAFKSRAKQVNVLSKHIQKSPYPVIICGDFNDTPSSYSYNVLTENMKDSFIEGGKGYGKTYDGNLPVFLRIDYVLYDDNFISCDFETSWIELSDHYPVSTNLIINDLGNMAKKGNDN